MNYIKPKVVKVKRTFVFNNIEFSLCLTESEETLNEIEKIYRTIAPNGGIVLNHCSESHKKRSKLTHQQMVDESITKLNYYYRYLGKEEFERILT